MNTNPITDAAAIDRIRQTGAHEWMVAGETYADWDSAMDAGRSELATAHAVECEQRAAEIRRTEDQLPRVHGRAVATVNGEQRTEIGLLEEAREYRKRALEYAMRAAR